VLGAFLTISAKFGSGPTERLVPRRRSATFRSPHADLGAWLEAVGAALPESLAPVCYGGVFATTGRAIARRGDVWPRLEASLTRDDSVEEGHFAERSWAGLLHDPLPADFARRLRACCRRVLREPFYDVARLVACRAKRRRPAAVEGGGDAAAEHRRTSG